MKKKLKDIGLPILCALLVNVIATTFFTYYSFNFIVNLSTFFLIGCFLILLTLVRSTLNRVLLQCWYYFYLCGILFLNSVSLTDDKLNITNENADNFYFFCLIALTCGIIASERIYRKRYIVLQLPPDTKLNGFFSILALIFPLLFLISTYLKVGYIMILSGDSIIDEMYTTDYGLLYSYKFFIIISVLVAVYYGLTKKNRIFYFSCAVSSLLISLIDGKRAIMLTAIIASLVFYYIYASKYSKINLKVILLFLFLTGGAYAGLATLRSGKSNELISVQSIIQKFPFGVEYTDYTYSFEKFKVGKMKNYDFLQSSFGAFMNGTILDLIGLDKGELVNKGSAKVWMDTYGINLGVRTGIVSELYFDYGYWTVLIFFFIGFYVDLLTRKIYASKDVFIVILLLSLYAFNALLIVGQATVFFGSLTLIIYLYIFYRLLELLKRRAVKRAALNLN
ncbi:MAG: oligosaccharide repeat unit polymerase [Bacteroidota bacterium]|nr:oligosaccharide repeat unit polymerase [Bacteroidota bacterium]